MELHKSGEDYLEAILMLQKKKGTGDRLVHIGSHCIMNYLPHPGKEKNRLTGQIISCTHFKILPHRRF